MKAARCMVGLHRYVPRQHPGTERSVTDVPGMELECTRCHKRVAIPVGHPSAPPVNPSPQMPSSLTFMHERGPGA